MTTTMKWVVARDQEVVDQCRGASWWSVFAAAASDVRTQKKEAADKIKMFIYGGIKPKHVSRSPSATQCCLMQKTQLRDSCLRRGRRTKSLGNTIV
jgi:hypothetical protein